MIRFTFVWNLEYKRSDINLYFNFHDTPPSNLFTAEYISPKFDSTEAEEY